MDRAIVNGPLLQDFFLISLQPVKALAKNPYTTDLSLIGSWQIVVIFCA